jgi:uncharacterized protein (DUF3820 family)
MSSTTLIKFGKHKGKTAEQLLVSDRAYLEWLVAQPFFTEYLIYQKVKDLLGVVGDAPVSASGSSTTESSTLPVMPGNEAGTVNFGKYKGQSPSVLFADTKYCQWLVEQGFFKKNKLYAEVIKLIGGSSTTSSIYESGSSGIVVAGDNGTVAFGKYRGQPLATLYADGGYCKWVIQQEWFAKNPLFAKVKEVADRTAVKSSAPESPCPQTPQSQGDSDHDDWEPPED